MHSRVLLVTPSAPDEHNTGPRHPECPARLDVARAGVRNAHLDDLATSTGRDASRAELELVHDDRYVRALEEFAAAGGGHLDPDTVVASGSYRAACVRPAVGSRPSTPWVTVAPTRRSCWSGRPAITPSASAPWVSACSTTSPIAARTPRRGTAQRAGRYRRLGCPPRQRHAGHLLGRPVRALRARPTSTRLYPGTGACRTRPVARTPGATINCPLAPGAGRQGHSAMAALDEVVCRPLMPSAPTCSLISAGFDAHRARSARRPHVECGRLSRACRAGAGVRACGRPDHRVPRRWL